MQNDRDRLIELISQAKNIDGYATPCSMKRDSLLADYLLANGVFILPEDLRDEKDFSLSAFIEAMKMYKEKDRYIKPPCKVGDIVYAKYSAPYIKQLGIEDVGYYVVDNVTHFGSEDYVFEAHLENEDGYTVDTIAFFQYEIGKTVFLTKEEAEKALAERSESK